LGGSGSQDFAQQGEIFGPEGFDLIEQRGYNLLVVRIWTFLPKQRCPFIDPEGSSNCPFWHFWSSTEAYLL